MSKVYSSAVVIIPPKEIWESIQEIRRLYDRNIDRWMPHITMLYPFRPKNQYDDMEKLFSEKCKGIEPFKVSLKIFSFFPHGHQKYTMWIDPEPNNSIIKLQGEILKLVSDCNDVNNFKIGFRPHLSVGQIKGKNKLHKTIKDLQANWAEIKFKLNKIFFISREKSKNSKFVVSKQIHLAQKREISP
ncbi:MAG: 2'-5' RNA ligase family protein [Promethearchaeota archaeon]|jgi:2'-5' RNA ligase